MAKKIKKRNIKQEKKVRTSPFSIYWEKNNYILFAAGILTLVIGFYFLSIGPWDSFISLAVSPILLFIAYILIFPASIFYRKKSKEKVQEENIAPRKS